MDGTLPKGDVVATARIAGIMAAKKTSELIPLCHPLALTHVGVEISPLPDGRTLQIIASAKTTGQTGVEMEALTAASVAALTVYDMVKAVDKSAVIESIRLLTKSGGKSGSYEAPVSGQAEAPSCEVRRRQSQTARAFAGSRPAGACKHFGRPGKSTPLHGRARLTAKRMGAIGGGATQ